MRNEFIKMSSGRFQFFFLALICFATATYAQPQYTIDITQQQYTLKTDFLKMGSNRSPTGEILSYNNLYLTKNGKPWFPIMGEMHYNRCAEKYWEEGILKMKAAGIEIISTYIFWNYIEPKEGVFDWTGNKNIKKFLSLCKKHHIYVWMRIGPWAHGENRYGGFPDWLIQKNIPLRKNDSTYLHYAKQYFDALGQQCHGLLFKDGGPVIGVQIENELVFKKPEVYEHMKTLKHLAIAAGFDVPYYSAFAQGPDTQDEFLYTIGGYPDSPWGSNTKTMFKPVFYIKPLEADSDIGSDLFGKVDSKVRNTYPKLAAELGAGMNKTYHRRVSINSKDVGAVAFTRIADGLNGLGYYMFHGGHHPIGETSLQESRITGYPNDMPYINYDYQAPIGDMGIINKNSFTEFRLLHLFAQSFGESLVTEIPKFPKAMVSIPFSYDTVQVSIRVKDNAGFIFLSNYQRHVDLPKVENFQLHLQTKNGIENIPQAPVSVEANSYAVWPYNLPINGAVLHYATAQPLCKLSNLSGSKENKETYVFFANNESEFVFNKSGVQKLENVNNCRINGFTVKANTYNNNIAVFNMVSSGNKKTTIIILSRSKALQAAKIKVGSKEVLLLSDAIAITDDNKLILEKTSKDAASFIEGYPDISIAPALPSFTIMRQKSNSVFASYSLSPKRQLKAHVNLVQNKSYDTASAQRFEDSVLQSYALIEKNRFNPKQPGNIYQLKFHNLPGQHTYNVSFTAPVNNLLKDWIADFNYVGDIIALYHKDSLVYDQFNYDNNLQVKLGFVLRNSSDTLLAQALPFKKDYDVYVEDWMKESKEKEWTKAILKSITLTPVYKYELMIK